MNADQAKALREPFPSNAIGKLPKGGVSLDFVGHAATTDRLLSVDPAWTWEPFAVDERGLPRLDESGGLWIRLTVCGVTRLGYGDASGKKGPNAVKEAIGDALRNAAMRFGVALDLWAKQDLQGGHEEQSQRDPVKAVKARIWTAAQARGWTVDDLRIDFAANHNDQPMDLATLDALSAYATLLETGEAAA